MQEELSWPSIRQQYELHSPNFVHKIHCSGEPEAIFSQLQVNLMLFALVVALDGALI